MRRPSPTAIRLVVLAAATFVFVTTETQPVALLAPMSRGLHVSESTVGLLMTAYAGAAAITAIPLTALTSRVSRRRLVILTVATLVASQVVLMLAPDYGVALGARLLGALAHGVFWSVVARVAASLVPRDRLGRATAAAFAGNSVALVAGTPLVSAIGALVGWRAAVGVMGAIALLVVVAMIVVLPEVATEEASTDRRSLVAGALRNRGVLIVSGATVLLAFGQFVAFTYLVPLVRAHTGLTGAGVSAVLLAYGAAGVLGVVRVGRAADHHPRAALLSCCVAIVVGLALIAAVAHGLPVMLVAVVLWGAGFTALPICLQAAVLRVAPRMPDTASSLYVVAFQIGIGGGALAGSALLGSGALQIIPDVALALFIGGSLLAAAARSTFGDGGETPPLRPAQAVAAGARRRGLTAHTVPHTSQRPSAARAIRSARRVRARARR